ncbi:4-alpha-glucanotransferase [Faunimonas sp. B44]|uniref:4-alpha-glucanotransferase n=1 Tax=Faunimonas sp. B44 TaxID=3461493 RepID=UPI0040446A89
MTALLDRLAELYGIERTYLGIDGSRHEVSDDARRATLEAMGVPAGTEAELRRGIDEATPVHVGSMAAPEGPRCFVPDWLKDGRTWGMTCQLYALRSDRNWGIGDFEDLARLAEAAAREGADLLGVNPLHALFLSEARRCSPFSPSNRQFLNPLYIAVDRLAGAEGLEVDEAELDELRSADHVLYPLVAKAKLRALEELFERSQADASAEEAFQAFLAHHGQSLYLHALFEAISERMVAEGHWSGWHTWPEPYRDHAGETVRAFAEENADRVTFHAWLQFVADRQLADAQRRARAAGMRIGLYVDLAVGVAADGSATWSDPELTVPDARIGAPPDYFNAAGQDWGIAPLSPATLEKRRFAPYHEALDDVVCHAGAVRIDHAMSLYRLYWIPDRFSAKDGVYVRYPFPDLLRGLAEVSQERQTLVIGEDLGVVPEGFREVMAAMEIHSYRVFFFERRNDHFLPPSAYPQAAMACISIHDLPSLAGWWTGRDLATRAEIGLIEPAKLPRERDERGHDRRRVLGALSDAGLLPEALAPVMRGEAEAPEELPPELAVALHRFVARTPSRLFAIPVDDLIASPDQVNIPGTTDEHPNWRQKLPVPIERVADVPLYQAICAAVREERPRAG